MIINPLHCIDLYKADHISQYPKGTTEVYSNMTARFSLIPNIDKIVFFGLQYFIKDFLIGKFGTWFSRREEEVINEYKEMIDSSLGENSISIEHIRALHRLQYLPIEIKALPEGTLIPIGVPFLTIKNTHPDFFWITNYIETAMSAYLWKPITNATIAYEYRKILVSYAKKTCSSMSFVDYQAHDFSFRGMSGLYDAAISGAAHLLSFKGTDTLLAKDFIKQFYNSSEGIGHSIPATEHSVMCMGTKDGELETYRRLITEVYPSGLVSIVSDTWDFWRVITEYLPLLKEDIFKREGKVVIRPDSGDPYRIIVGDKDAPQGSPQYKGVVECLWEIFGGKINAKGFRILHSKIGLIYGDSITLARCESILQGLYEKGFASENVVFGVGSYTYQYVTRDTFGFAIKSTSGVVNGERREIFKNPLTDDGRKKSAKGLLYVDYSDDCNLIVIDQCSEEDERIKGFLNTVFMDGELMRDEYFSCIRRPARKVYL